MVGKGGEGCTLASMPARSAAPQHVAISMRRTGSSEHVSKRGRGRRLVTEKLATAPYYIGLTSGLHETKANSNGCGPSPFDIAWPKICAAAGS